MYQRGVVRNREKDLQNRLSTDFLTGPRLSLWRGDRFAKAVIESRSSDSADLRVVNDWPYSNRGGYEW